LEKLGPAAKEAIPALTESLKDKDADVRAFAQKALDAVAGKAPPPPKDDLASLMKQLQDKDAKVRLKAVQKLAALGPAAKDAVPALTEAVKDRDEDVRAAAKKALLAVKGENPALAQIRKDLKSKKRAERAKAVEELAQLGEDGRDATADLLLSMREIWPVNKEAYLDCLEKIEPALHKPISTLILDTDQTNWFQAMQTIGNMGTDGEHALPLLVGISKTYWPQQSRRVDAQHVLETVTAMSQIAPEKQEVLQTIVALLSAPNGYSYSGATTGHSRPYALELAEKLQISPKFIVPALIQWLNDSTPVVTQKRRDTTLQLLAIRKLGAYGAEAKAAIPALDKLRFSSSKEVRDEAKAALESIKEK
jgi:HEAT repeat protein